MVIKSFLFLEKIILLILSITNCSSTSSIFPIYKLLISKEINKMSARDIFRNKYNMKGVGIIFNKDSDISLMPKNLFTLITNYYHDSYYYSDKIEKVSNKYDQYLLIESTRPFETIYFNASSVSLSFIF